MKEAVGKQYGEISAEKTRMSKAYVTAHPASIVSASILRYELMYEMDWEELEQILSALDPSIDRNGMVIFLKDRVGNPNIVSVYDDFHAKGFNILGVSIDTDRNKWQEAIEKDLLTWTHVSDLEGWQSTVAGLYAVQSIPHSILVDKNGVIVEKNLRGAKLREKIASLLPL